MGIVIILIGIGAVLFFAREPIIEAVSPMPDDLGVSAGGQLKPCPRTPDCVSTQAPENDRIHRFRPIKFEGSTEDIHDAFLDIVQAMPKSTLITNEPTYLHFELRSPTMGFIDDFEVYIDADNTTVHLRSAARLGLADGGANRRYAKHVRDEFNKTEFAVQSSTEDN